MLFITPATGAKEAKDYFTRHMSTSDYYLRDAVEFAGQWHGLGAELLGLSGTIDKESYFKLCDNINPKTNDEPLTARTKTERRVLYDFTFDAPKSVTLAYELGGDERIMDAFRGAVKDTMAEMEGAMMVRVRSNGRSEDRPSSNMIWGEFVHRTTRPVDGVPDPHLHCHAVAFNATWDPEEERWKAAQFGDIVRDKGYYQAAFHSRLAERLADLGYGIERDKNSFRLAGIERETTDKFSRRSSIIEAEAKRLGITDEKAKEKLGRRTREKKNEHELSLAELRKEWAARLSGDEGDAIVKARRGHETTSLSAGQAMDYALSHCFERGSAIPEKQLLRTALTQSVGAASVDEIKRQLARDNVVGRKRLGQHWVTTREVLREEIEMTAFVREGRGRRHKLGGKMGTPNLDPELSAEQRKAALVILNSTDIVTALQGGAGTGKTRMMQATVAAIEASGKKVFTFAPSAEASRGVLRAEGFKDAETVERLLIDPKMQAQVKGGVLWVDEAGLLSVKDMKRLLDVAKEQDARVVLSGDSKQHSAVYRGDALRILEKDAGLRVGRLSQVRRQTNETYRNAVKAISQGDTLGKDGRTKLEAGIEMLDNMGAIIEADGDGRYKAIADDYARVISQFKGNRPKSALVVSPTHREGEKVTQAIRESLKGAGRVSGRERNFLSLRSLNLTEAERGDAREYSEGSVVQFHQNAKGFKRGERVTVVDARAGRVSIKRADGGKGFLPLQEAQKFQLYAPGEVALAKGDKLRLTQGGYAQETRGLLGKTRNKVNNGQIYEVEGFTRDGDIKLGNGYVLPKNYGGIMHGYVVTSHASQGRTVDAVLIAMGNESLSAASREQFYVSVSRGREAVRLYTDDKEAMMDAVQRSGARLSATELMQGEEAKPKPKRKIGLGERMFKMRQTYRLWMDKRARIAAWDAVHQQREGRGLDR
jgi:conjugative relaxase-like TrwC/TraI family protein